MPPTKVQKDRVNDDLRVVRAALTECRTLFDAGDLSGAYAAAEKAQHLSFDLKRRIDSIAHEPVRQAG